MSLNIPKKISDHFSCINLATNGNFSIDQRGIYDNYTSITTSSYLCDCWYISYTDVSSCYAKYEDGVIHFKGYANAGESVYIANRDTYDIGYQTDDESSELYNPITSIAEFIVYTGKLKVISRPRYNSSYYSNDQNNPKTIYTNKSNVFGRASRCIETLGTAINFRALIIVEFLEDGEFDFTLLNFKELSGRFLDNPPLNDSYYNINHDLERCKMWYQTRSEDSSIPVNWYLTWYFVEDHIKFNPQMISTPSVSVVKGNSYIIPYCTTGLPVLINYNNNPLLWQTPILLTNNHLHYQWRFTYGSYTNYQILNVKFTWTAEIA